MVTTCSDPTAGEVVYQQLLPRIGGGKSHQLRNVVATGVQDQMQTLEMALSDLVTRGVVTYEEAVARSIYPEEVAKPPAGPAVQPAAAS